VRIVRRRNVWRRQGRSTAREEAVTEIIGRVQREKDAALIELTETFDGVTLAPGRLRVSAAELAEGLAGLDAQVRQALETAIANVRSVAEAQLRDVLSVELPQGQRVEIAEAPVRRAGIYVPGGRAPYPSTVVMCAVTAISAGVEQVAVCAPPGPDGEAHPVILGACALCGVDEVYRVGGAQAIAALAHGTETVEGVDVIVGPGNAWVTEAKRQVYGQVGIDGLAGPSELVVLASPGADPDLAALDLLAQAEHGEDSPLWLISPDQALVDAVVDKVERLAPERPSVADAELQAITVATLEEGLSFAEDIAPEHLELVGTEAEALAGQVGRAGCLFVGAGAATAFGDYVAGSNHVLPTGGAARFQSALSPATFRRRLARVSLPGQAPARLAPAGAALARAEGFPVHAESMERRA
jgi:histidinol dehydrogenase